MYLVRPGENDDLEGVDDSETERREYVFDHMEAMTSEDGLQADERMRDSIDSVGIVLREQIYGSESEEDWEEIVEAGEHIVRATEHIASGTVLLPCANWLKKFLHTVLHAQPRKVCATLRTSSHTP